MTNSILKIGFLQVGINKDFPSGVTRYGMMLANGMKEFKHVQVCESFLTLTTDQSKNKNTLTKAIEDFSKCDLVFIQFSSFIWGQINLWVLCHVIIFKLKLPMVMTLHDTGYLNFIKDLKGILLVLFRGWNLKLFIKNAWQIVCRLFLVLFFIFRCSKIFIHSNDEKKCLPCLSAWKHKLSVIPHFVEEREIRVSKIEAKRYLGLTNKLVVTILGFILPRKGYHLVLKGAENFPEGTLINFAGVGEEKYVEGLKDLALKCGVVQNFLILTTKRS